MKELNVIVKKENTNWHSMTPEDFKAWFDEESCLWVSGSVRCDADEEIGPYERHIKAAICEVNEGRGKRVIYTMNAYEALSFEMTNYGTFTMRSSSVSKLFNENDTYYIELFPEYVKKEEKW